MTIALTEYLAGQIWLGLYPVHYAGLDFYSRMTVVRLADGTLVLHSPCNIDPELKQSIEMLGDVRHIVAPGSYHYLHVASAQKAFPEATTYICPGIEQKMPDLEFDWILGDTPSPDLAVEFDQVLVRGAKYIWEVAFFHKPSRTLLLAELVENIGDRTEGVGIGLKIWWKAVFHMWNKAKPAPEYQMGWKDKAAAKRSLERILDWDFAHVILAHGDLIEEDARSIVRQAWSNPLGSGEKK